MPKHSDNNSNILQRAFNLVDKLAQPSKFSREIIKLPELLMMSPLGSRITVVEADGPATDDVPWISNSCEWRPDVSNIESEGWRDEMRHSLRQAIAHDLTETIMHGDTESDDPELRIMDGWIKLREQKRNNVRFEVDADVRVEMINEEPMAFRLWTRLRAVPL